MNRRRALESIVANIPQYRLTTYSYLYHDLIASTLDNRPVRNQGKDKLVKLEGNSNVKNQLVQNGNFSDTSRWAVQNATLTVSNNIGTLTTTAQGVILCRDANIEANLENHTYLYVSYVKVSNACEVSYNQAGNRFSITNITTTNTWVMLTYIGTRKNAYGNIGWQIDGTSIPVGSTIQLSSFVVVDLTQQFGTGNEPTSVSDKRIKKIIADGYRPYNAGKMQSSIVESIDTESFNIFDEEMTFGYYWGGSIGGDIGKTALSDRCCSTNLLEVLPNKTYYCKGDRNFYFWYLDKDKKILGYSGWITSNQTITTPNNCRYICFTLPVNIGTYNHDICINRSSDLNGTYRPYYERYKLSHFNPVQVGTDIVNSFKSTTGGYIFKKVVGEYTFTGNENWQQGSTGNNYYCSVSGLGVKCPSVSDTPNAYCSFLEFTSYDEVTNTSTNGKIAFHPTNDTIIAISIDVYNNRANLVGKSFYYELATSQTITIPQCHLGMVDLGTLNWTLAYSNNAWYTDDITDGVSSQYIGVPAENIFAEKYVAAANPNEGGSNIMNYYITGSTKRLVIANGSTTTPPSGYLYYETTNIVDESSILFDTMQIKLPAPLELDGVNSVRNTFEITTTEYVFTRKTGRSDLGGLNWEYKTEAGGNVFPYPYFQANISDMAIGKNMLCSLYTSNGSGPMGAVAFGSVSTNMEMCAINNAWGGIGIHNNSYTNATTFKNAMSGVPLYYELATPQVIKIPRKHLKAVDLGSLGWIAGQYGNASGWYSDSITDIQTVAYAGVPNIFSSNYQTVGSTAANLLVGTITVAYGSTRIWVGRAVGDTTNPPTGILFYETQDEVEDFAQTKPVLPEDYQEVEYIESTGTQYIDTGVIPSSKQKLILDCEITNVENSKYLCGQYTSTIEYFLYSRQGVYQWGWSCIHKDSTVTVDSSRHVLSLYCNSGTSYFEVDGVVKDSKTSSIMNATANFYLFKGTDNGSLYNSLSQKVYCCKLYDDGILIRDFIPCYRKSDGTVGLYDLVGHKFYTNAGTGTFLMGNDVFRYTSEAIFQKGGSIMSHEFAWVKNQLVKNGDFNDSSVWVAEPQANISISGGVLTLTNTVIDNGFYQNATYSLNGHKMLLIVNVKGESGSTELVYNLFGYTTGSITGISTNWQTKTLLFTISNTGNKFGLYPHTANGTFYFENVRLIDLTASFGAGNEPTSTSDFRIQEIISNGYIPTNTNGTFEKVESEVLVNAGMKIQVK